MKGKVGTSTQMVRTGIPSVLPRTPFGPLGARISVQWWYEWMQDGHREKSPPYRSLGRDGVISAACSLIMGREKYGIRHGSEVIIPNRHREHGGVRVSRIYIDGRLIGGDELKAILAKAETYRDRKRQRTAERLQKLDTALALIR